MASQDRLFEPGDCIEVRALKSDGTVYRQWRATVESAREREIATVNDAGEPVLGSGGGWKMRHWNRSVYWIDRPYNLSESYEASGKLKQIYVHIASPAKVSDNCLQYVDYELDVVKRAGEGVLVRDEDEFEQAARAYGYSSEFCASCQQAVLDAKALIEQWKASGSPRKSRSGTFGLSSKKDAPISG